MLKNILNLTGAHQLSKEQQKAINGGAGYCITNCGPGMPPCPGNESCVTFSCEALGAVDLYSYCVGDGNQ